MDGKTLVEMLNFDALIKAKFGGICCSDELEYPLRKDKIWVLNLAPSSNPVGEHWCIAHSCRPNFVEYLCSANSDYTLLPHVKKCFDNYPGSVYTFPKRTQAEWSTDCANFTAFHAWMVARNIFGPDIYQRFYDDKLPISKLYKHDIFVCSVVETLFQRPKGQALQLILDLDFLCEQSEYEKKRQNQQQQSSRKPEQQKRSKQQPKLRP